MEDLMRPGERKNKDIFRAASHALDGLRELWLEKAARRELAVLFGALALFCFFPDRYSFALLVLSFVLLAIESLNSAIEALCDHVTPEIHPAIKKAKDLGAAAIFIVSAAMGLVALLFLAGRVLG